MTAPAPRRTIPITMTTTATTDQRLTRLEAVYEHVATKADLAAAEARLQAQIAAAKVEIANLKADLARMENRFLRWIVPTIFGGISIGMGVAVAVASLFS